MIGIYLYVIVRAYDNNYKIFEHEPKLNYKKMHFIDDVTMRSSDKKLRVIKFPRFADPASSMFDIKSAMGTIEKIHVTMSQMSCVPNYGITSEFIMLTGSNAVQQN